jgi:N-sulfoglucosamine sulfohydrolase
MFLSDHGMPLPFAKTQLYHHSTRTPWIIRWPGVTKADSVNDSHMISAVDLLPTVLDMAVLKKPDALDGQSFVPVMRGQQQDGRHAVFKVYNENAGGNRHPIRGVQTRKHLYLFNPWSDGENVFRTATNGTATYRQMKKLAATDQKIATRLATMDHRNVEELYDVEKDPDCLHNLAGEEAHQDIKRTLQARLRRFMEESNDHALAPFLKRNDPTALAVYMKKVQDESVQRRAARRKGKNKNKAKQKGPRKKAP